MDRRFNTVLTSAAGYPLDATYYQTVKGMVGPLDILAPGGDLIVASACSEGFGSAHFADAQRRLVADGPDRFLEEISGKSHAAIDEWQTEMQLRPMRAGTVHLFTEGLAPEERALTGVRMDRVARRRGDERRRATWRSTGCRDSRRPLRGCPSTVPPRNAQPRALSASLGEQGAGGVTFPAAGPARPIDSAEDVMGWQGRLLRVDLTAGTCAEEALNMEWAQSYLGSRGLATKYLVEEMDPKADPLSPDNKLIFATGPLTGTTAPTGGRYTVVTKGGADQRHRLLQLGRLLRRRAQARGLGHGDLRGPLATPRLSLHQGRPRRAGER